MNANTKWETVEPANLVEGDQVVAKHENGSRLVGEFIWHDGQFIKLKVSGSIGWVFEAPEWQFERAVPERTLPTEPGIYIDPSRSLEKFDSVYTLTPNGNWVNDRSEDLDADGVPSNLVRLVPVTEVEELRERIEKVRSFVHVRRNYYLDEIDITRMLGYLDGEA